MLQEGAVERYVVRDAVDDRRVPGRTVHLHGAGVDKLGLNAIDIARVDVLHQRAWKAVLHAEQNADFFHAALPLDA